MSNESHKIKKTRKKWDNFSFTIPDYIKLLDPKAQRKEIQKLKNRISAQLSRDKKKIESDSIQTMNYQLEQENRKLLKEISVIRQENEFLLKKMSEFKCIRCGFSNSQKEEKEVLSDTNDNSISPFGTRHFSRTSSFSLFLGTLTILGTLALFCLVVPFYSNDSQMSNSNMFAQINQSINPQYECKKFFFKNEKEKWRETMY